MMHESKIILLNSPYVPEPILMAQELETNVQPVAMMSSVAP